jgi:hypothetical protein
MSSRWLIGAVLLVTGAVHLLPLLGVLGAARLEQLYGLRIEDPNLLLLMRHRALLFGLLGVLLCAAAFRPAWQGLALGAAWISVPGFVVLAPSGLLPALQRVWWIDVALLPLLALASTLWFARASPRTIGPPVDAAEALNTHGPHAPPHPADHRHGGAVARADR